jgi:CMP-2-keto-3-deoxyoctulosonic acid synthetase
VLSNCLITFDSINNSSIWDCRHFHPRTQTSIMAYHKKSSSTPPSNWSYYQYNHQITSRTPTLCRSILNYRRQWSTSTSKHYFHLCATVNSVIILEQPNISEFKLNFAECLANLRKMEAGKNIDFKISDVCQEMTDFCESYQRVNKTSVVPHRADRNEMRYFRCHLDKI